MKSGTTKMTSRFLALGVCLLTAGASRADLTELYFRAGAVTNTMPDGRQVVLWGFAQDSSGEVQDGVIAVPGPAVNLPAGSQDLLIHLTNTLPQPVSIVIPGLPAALGNPQRNLDGRARAFTHEAPSGGSADFAWNDIQPGTYVYHSGSHPAVQVQMGLYGALTKLFASRKAYDGMPDHDGDVTVFFSAIDPALHDAVATGNYGPSQAVSSTIGYVPEYFLINGRPYTRGHETNAVSHLLAATVPANGASRTVLMRFLNADIDYHVPMLNGQHMDFVAEDGKVYPATRKLTAAILPPLKTMDAYFTAATPGTIPLYDRRLSLSTTTNSPGGMLTYLAVARHFQRSAPISIPSSGNASPYPAPITVSGLQGVVSRVTVRLALLSHVRPGDVDVLLVGPAGQKVMLMSDVGGSTPVLQANITFDDAAPAGLTADPIPSSSELTFKPTNLAGFADTFPAPAPAAPYAATLGAFTGTSPNGVWSLFVRDNRSDTGGLFAGGWSLTITPRPAY